MLVYYLIVLPAYSVYLSLSNTAPAYLSADCQLVVSCVLPHQGRVLSDDLLYYGDRCFVAAGPTLWNSLPADLRQADINFQRFKRLLKTFLFGC